MALLLAMYQKMRLVREKNQLTLDQTKVQSRKKTVQANIKTTQKRFTSMIENIKAQAKNASNQASIWANQNAGLGMGNNFNPWAFGNNSLSQFIMSGMNAWVQQNQDAGDRGISNASDIFSAYQTGGTFKARTNENGEYLDKDGNVTKNQNDYVMESQDGSVSCSVAEWQEFQKAMQQCQYQQNVTQSQVQQWTSNYQSQISIWEQEQIAMLDAAQDEALEPLNYEDTMLDLESSQNEIRLEQIKAELQSYESLVKDEIQNTTPKFGLG